MAFCQPFILSVDCLLGFDCTGSSLLRTGLSSCGKWDLLSSCGMWLLFAMASLVAATAKSLQSCPTLCDPRDGSPSGSPVPGILQARTLEWLAISFSHA